MFLLLKTNCLSFGEVLLFVLFFRMLWRQVRTFYNLGSFTLKLDKWKMLIQSILNQVVHILYVFFQTHFYLKYNWNLNFSDKCSSQIQSYDWNTDLFFTVASKVIAKCWPLSFNIHNRSTKVWFCLKRTGQLWVISQSETLLSSQL